MKSKRGVTQTQFNWIFIMIAGALILLFFVSIVYKQKSVSEQKTDITIQKNLQEILTNAEISKQTEQVITAPEREFRYSCEGFSVGSLDSFNPRIVFAPDLLKSNKRELILYSLEWRVPFRIVNFIYVTSPEIRYIIVNDSGNLAEELYDLLPENIDKKIVNQGSIITDKNNYKIKKICFDNCLLAGIDASEVKIIPTEGGLDGHGKIEIDDREVGYLKKESVVAAVFSENADIYECNMEKAMTRLKKVYDVYKNRVDELKGIKPECDTYYNNINFNPDFNDHSNIYNNIKNIENQNNGAQILSCPLIY